jgi:putative flavoprotein involved in K+ transport
MSGAPERIATVVIGGGQAGLAVGYHLARRELPFVILDASARIGDSWRRRWDSLRLFTEARLCALPGWPFPGRNGHFPDKDEAADYLEAYARKHALPVQSGVTVDRVARDGDRFVVSAGDRTLLAEQVVVATGPFQRPRVPSFASELDPGILQLHSSEYRNPAQLASGEVLVVGAGNSGAEIAMEAARAGHKTWLSGRVTGEETPFELGGLAGNLLTPVMWFAGTRLLTTRTFAGRKLRARALSTGWPLVRVRNKAVAAAGIERLPRTAGTRDGAPLLDDGRVLRPANVVWATGYEEDFGWIALPLLGPDGRVAHDRGVVAAHPGLYFVGLLFLYSATSALMGGVGRDAEHIVGHIAARQVTRASATAAPRCAPAPREGTASPHTRRPPG